MLWGGQPAFVQERCGGSCCIKVAVCTVKCSCCVSRTLIFERMHVEPTTDAMVVMTMVAVMVLIDLVMMAAVTVAWTRGCSNAIGLRVHG